MTRNATIAFNGNTKLFNGTTNPFFNGYIDGTEIGFHTESPRGLTFNIGPFRKRFGSYVH